MAFSHEDGVSWLEMSDLKCIQLNLNQLSDNNLLLFVKVRTRPNLLNYRVQLVATISIL